FGQRSRKRQPAGGLSSDGGAPGMPDSRRSVYRTPTSGSELISAWAYGWRGLLTIAEALAFSTSLPAYMTMIVSAMWYVSEMSWVTKIMLLTKPRSRNPASAFATAFWVDTSSAEVTSSAMSSDGLSSVEITITVRCFMPPDSSIGYRLSTSGSSPTSLSRRSSSSSTSAY